MHIVCVRVVATVVATARPPPMSYDLVHDVDYAPLGAIVFPHGRIWRIAI